jgi:hypothetical protein
VARPPAVSPGSVIRISSWTFSERAGSAAAPYYTRPSLDFSRPGRTWLPTMGETRFPLWQLISTWYHEGVPGHHLQLGQWTYLADRLSTYQTSIGAVSGNLEGWALYAERLMADLGYLDDPGDRLGMLDAQALRAARVVVDMGVHLGLDVPEQLVRQDGLTPGRWTAESAWDFMRKHIRQDEKILHFDMSADQRLNASAEAIGAEPGERGLGPCGANKVQRRPRRRTQSDLGQVTGGGDQFHRVAAYIGGDVHPAHGLDEAMHCACVRDRGEFGEGIVPRVLV